MDREAQNIVQDMVTKTIWKKKKCKTAKWLSQEALQIAETRREGKGKGERKDTPSWMQSSREYQGEIKKKAFLVKNAKKKGKTIEWERLETTSREGTGNPLQYSCLENPMGRGAW